MAGDRSNASVVGAAGGPPGGQDEVFLAAHEAAQAQRDSQARVCLQRLWVKKIEALPFFPRIILKEPENGRVTLSTRHSCTDCGKNFILKANLLYHQCFECSVQPKYGCPYCDRRFKHEFSISKHIKMCVTSFVRSLNIDKRRGDPYTLNFYERYSCADCGRSYKQKAFLSRHLRLKCGQQLTFSCPYCDYRTKQQYNMKKHISRCMNSFIHSLNVNNQSKNPYIPNIYELYSCSNCGRSYKRKGNLSRHLLYWCGRVPSYTYPYCNYRFKDTSMMRTHICLKHPPKKNCAEKLVLSQIEPSNANEWYSCAACDKLYKRKGMLSSHLRFECDRVLNFECPYYEFSSKYSYSVTKHISYEHPGEQISGSNPAVQNINNLLKNPRYIANRYARYSCADCGKSYKLKCILRRHISFNCGRRSRYECQICDQSPRSSSNKRKHVQGKFSTKKNRTANSVLAQNVSKLPKNPRCVSNIYERYNCADCCRSYKHKQSLIRHLRTQCRKPLCV